MPPLICGQREEAVGGAPPPLSRGWLPRRWGARLCAGWRPRPGWAGSTWAGRPACVQRACVHTYAAACVLHGRVPHPPTGGRTCCRSCWRGRRMTASSLTRTVSSREGPLCAYIYLGRCGQRGRASRITRAIARLNNTCATFPRSRPQRPRHASRMLRTLRSGTAGRCRHAPEVEARERSPYPDAPPQRETDWHLHWHSSTMPCVHCRAKRPAAAALHLPGLQCVCASPDAAHVCVHKYAATISPFTCTACVPVHG